MSLAFEAIRILGSVVYSYGLILKDFVSKFSLGIISCSYRGLLFAVLYFNDELKFKLEAFMAAIHKEEASGSLIEPISPLLPKPGR